jgi:ribosomal protein S18 acetylase RimI-like enzyme
MIQVAEALLQEAGSNAFFVEVESGLVGKLLYIFARKPLFIMCQYGNGKGAANMELEPVRTPDGKEEVVIRLADPDEAHLIHQITMAAFAEYEHDRVPSAALNETVEFIRERLEDGDEQALLCIQSGRPIGTVRFQMDEHSLSFFRLAACPKEQGKGRAKAMLAWLERYAKENGKKEIWCNVRRSVARNIRLYQSVGYALVQEQTVISANGVPVKVVMMKKEITGVEA